MTDPLKVDDQQLASVLREIHRSPPPRFSFQQCLSLLQVVAILAAGLIAFHEYVSYRSKLAELELQQKTEERIIVRGDKLTVTEISRFDDGSRLYKAVLTLGLENGGESEFEITYTVIESFIGSMPEEVPHQSVVQINEPPDIFNAETTGCVQWEKISQYASQYKSSSHDMGSFFANNGYNKIDSGEGLCAHLRMSEKTCFKYTYMVRTQPENLLAFVVNIGIDGATSGPNAWYFKLWERLTEVNKTADLPHG